MHLQGFAHSDESLLLQIWGNKVKTCTDDALMLQQTALGISNLNDCYWFKKPILVLIRSLSGIDGNLRSAESSPVKIKFYTKPFP